MITLADLRLAQGRLREAGRIFTEGVGLGTSAGGPPLRGTADMYVGLSTVLLERGDLAAAADHLAESMALGEHNGLPQHPYRSRLAMARLHEAEGDFDAALALLDEAERVYATDFSPSVRPIPAVRAEVNARHGKVGDAMAWVRERGVTVDDELHYLTEFEHITLARVLLAQFRTGRSDRSVGDAARLLGRLLAAAEDGGRDGAVLEILVLLASVEEARGDRTAAKGYLDRAKALAEPEGYVRVFGDGSHHPVRVQPLVDQLSERELDVLRLLGSELSGPEIARELIVSLNTMRTHTKSIYSKLGVTSRRAAVRQANELGLLSRSRTTD